MNHARFGAWEQEIDAGLVPASIFGDPEIFEMELRGIFGRTWVFVAHETELPNRGDFVVRKLGRDEVIVVRDKTGVLRVHLNHCRHRGTTLCREHKGNARQFRCPYHGWVFDTTGAFVGAPFKNRAYPGLDVTQWGLLSAARVETYRGLIFATLDEEADSLVEHLGPMCWYLDCAFALHPDGMRVHAEPQRWRVRANWKTPAENFLSDGYHVATLHRSVEDVGLVPDVDRAANQQFHLDTENGHGAILSPRVLPPPWGTWGYPPMVTKLFELEQLNTEQRAFLDAYLITTFTIYPNLSFIRVPGFPEPGVAPVVYTCLRQWQPVAPDVVEIWNYTLSWKVAPDWFNDATYKASLSAFGPAGMFEQDDAVAWAGIPAFATSTFADGRASAHYQMGRGGSYGRRADWMGPGFVSNNAFGDQPQRSFYKRWLGDLVRAAAPRSEHRRLTVVEQGVAV